MKTDSYPPLFHPTNQTENVDLDESGDEAGDFDPVPVIDLQCLDPDNLGQACREWGLFRLANHSVPSSLLSQIQRHAKELFDLSFEYKQGILGNPLSHFWGTTSRTTTGAPLKSSHNISWVEVINFPLNKLSELQTQDPLLDSFRLLVEEYGKYMARIARTLYEAMANNLNLDTKQSKSYLSESTGFIRIHRYPPISKGSEGWGVCDHTDSSVLTLLNQNQVSGLQVLKDDKWFSVKPVSETLVVNLGDMMQAMSGDEYVSAKHRVKVNRQEDRISICYFVFPEHESLIQSSNYKPFTYNDYHVQSQRDMETLGFKVGLQRFKIIRKASSRSTC